MPVRRWPPQSSRARVVWLAIRATLPPPRVSRLQITPPSAAAPTITALTVAAATRDVAITPDGTRVVYVGANGTTLFVRPLDQLDATPLTGLGAPTGPFVSPDGQWIGFADGDESEEGRDHRRPGGHADPASMAGSAAPPGLRTARSCSRPATQRPACSGSRPVAASRPC